MDHSNTGLLSVLLDVYQNRFPNFIHLTPDKLWVADLALQEDGNSALTLQCFDLEGRECLNRTLYQMGAECPAPYCWFTDNAVVLFHAPEDPADPEEDTALTLRWFPLDTLEEQVWPIEPRQLPGQLSGVIRHWNRGEILTVQGAFLKGDDVLTACVDFDLTHRRISVSKPGLFGSPEKGEPPERGPDPERLVYDKKLIQTMNSAAHLPNGVIVIPTAIQADEACCRVECLLQPPDSDTLDDARTEVCTGPHCGFLFPLTVDSYRCVLVIRDPLLLPCMDLKGPFPGEETSERQPVQFIQGSILEVERGFADAHLTRSCREVALYRDDKCYRWRFDHTAWAVCYELPALFASPSYPFIMEMLSTYCGSYLSRREVNGDKTITFDTVPSYFAENWHASRALLEALPADYQPPQAGPWSNDGGEP